MQRFNEERFLDELREFTRECLEAKLSSEDFATRMKELTREYLGTKNYDWIKHVTEVKSEFYAVELEKTIERQIPSRVPPSSALQDTSYSSTRKSRSRKKQAS